jgi:hypothetical protein
MLYEGGKCTKIYDVIAEYIPEVCEYSSGTRDLHYKGRHTVLPLKLEG